MSAALSPLHRNGRLELVNTALAVTCVVLAGSLVLAIIAAVN